MAKFAMVLSYDGTGYKGWQLLPPNEYGPRPSIQEELQKVLRRMSHEEVTVTGSGRTDAGVHAVGQVAHFVLTTREWDPEILFRGMNSLLPQQIRVRKVLRVPDDFHAQRSARKKRYGYYFQQGPVSLPHLHPYSWWIRHPLDVEAMDRAAKLLIGRHDFKVFQGPKATTKTTVREILEASVRFQAVGFPGIEGVTAEDGGGRRVGLVKVELVGTGFLKQMVRSISGTLLEIGNGTRPVEDMRRLVETQAREDVGVTAPGRGLWLEKVWYEGWSSGTPGEVIGI